MGFVLGILFGLVARYTVAQALVLGFSAACAMTLLPIATDVFGRALTPISEACQDFMRRHSAGREVLIGLDIPILLGSTEIWAAAMVSVPFTLLWAIVMPWNNMLPFASIVNYGCALVAFYVCEGNLLRMVILMAGVSAPIFLWCGNAVVAWDYISDIIDYKRPGERNAPPGFLILVGWTGFEPATPCPPVKCALWVGITYET